MTFPAFPKLPGLEFPVTRAPKAKTLNQVAISGRQTDQPLWNAPLYDYEVSFSLLRSIQAYREWQLLEDFWKTVKFIPPCRFTFDDPNDDSVTAQPTGTGDGTTQSFQLVRTLYSFTEPVLVPVCGPNAPAAAADYGNCTVAPGPTLDYGNCTVAPTADIDDGYCSTLQVFEASSGPEPTVLAPWSFANGSAQASGGVVVISPAPGNNVALSWTGDFLWLCRFSADTLSFANFMYQFFSLKKCAFETARV